MEKDVREVLHPVIGLLICNVGTWRASKTSGCPLSLFVSHSTAQNGHSECLNTSASVRTKLAGTNEPVPTR